jgi:SIR2-like domain
MLMVIFGAGASYDSVPTYPPGTHIDTGDALNNFHRPPLANELFENRPVFADAITRFPACQPIVPRLRRLKGETLEAALQDLQARAIDYPRGLQQLAAVRYYLQYILWQCSIAWRGIAQGVTNYKTLLDQIERTHRKNDPVCIVTFNYDTLLEDALNNFGLSIGAISDYTKKHAFYKVFKVHGSVNWARVLKNTIQSENPGHAWSVANEWIERAADLSFTDNYTLTDTYPTAVVTGQPVFPAIAIPVERDKTFECPPGLIEELIALLPHVSKVLVIGWRATEAHFLELLKMHLKSDVHLHVVAKGLKDADDAKVSICRALMNNRPSHVSLSDEGFTDFILSGAPEKFLNS